MRKVTITPDGALSDRFPDEMPAVVTTPSASAPPSPHRRLNHEQRHHRERLIQLCSGCLPPIQAAFLRHDRDPRALLQTPSAPVTCRTSSTSLDSGSTASSGPAGRSLRSRRNRCGRSATSPTGMTPTSPPVDGSSLSCAYGGGDVGRYLHEVKDVGFDVIEISTGFVMLPTGGLERLVEEVVKAGLKAEPELGISSPRASPRMSSSGTPGLRRPSSTVSTWRTSCSRPPTGPCSSGT